MHQRFDTWTYCKMTNFPRSTRKCVEAYSRAPADLTLCFLSSYNLCAPLTWYITSKIWSDLELQTFDQRCFSFCCFINKSFALKQVLNITLLVVPTIWRFHLAARVNFMMFDITTITSYPKILISCIVAFRISIKFNNNQYPWMIR